MRNGLFLANDAIALAIRLECAGHVMTAADGLLKVSGGATLTADDRAQITRWRLHLLAIADYGQEEAR